MAQNKLTLIAELKDYVTGPAKKATASVEGLGTATAASGKKAEAAHAKAGKAADTNATRTGKAAGRMAQAFQRIDGRAGRMASALGRHSGTGATAIERASGRMSTALSRVDAAGAATKFGRGMTSMASHASDAAAKIESAMSRAGKAIGIAVTGLAGASLYGGVNRLMNLESADVKFDVMGYDEDARKGIMDTVNTSVEGTPFGLDVAATSAAQYLAAGVTPEDLESKMKTTVDLAAIYDMELGDASAIFSKVIANGAIQGDEAAQLLDRGMNIRAPLAEHLGVDQSEIKDMISEGKVSADDLFAALGPAVEGGAEKLGDTFKGTFANLRTAFSKAGAAFEAPLMSPVKDLMESVRSALKAGSGEDGFFTKLGEKMAPGIATAAEHAPKLMAALEPLGGPLLAAASSFADLIPYIVQGFTAWFTVLGLILPPLINLVSFIGELVGPFLPVLIPLLLGAGTAFTTWKVLKLISPLLGGVGKGLKILKTLLMNHPLLRLATLLYAGIKALEWLYNNSELVRKEFDAIGDAVRGALRFFDKLVDKISDLIENKFPGLHKAAKKALTFGSGKESGEAGSTEGDAVMRWGASIGQQLGLPDVGGRREALMERATGGPVGGRLPGYSPGVDNMLFRTPVSEAPFLALSGGEHIMRPEVGRAAGWLLDDLNHAAIMGGPQGVREAVKGAVEYRAQGGTVGAAVASSKPRPSRGGTPVRPVAATAPVTVHGDTVTFEIYDARDPQAVVAQIEAYMSRRDREKRLTTSTLTKRGAN